MCANSLEGSGPTTPAKLTRSTSRTVELKKRPSMLITYAKWSCHGEEAQTAAALEAAGCVVLAYAGQLSHLYRNPWRICERRTAFGGRRDGTEACGSARVARFNLPGTRKCHGQEGNPVTIWRLIEGNEERGWKSNSHRQLTGLPPINSGTNRSVEQA